MRLLLLAIIALPAAALPPDALRAAVALGGAAVSAQETSKSTLVNGKFEANEYGFLEFCKTAGLVCGILIDDAHPFYSHGRPIEVPRMDLAKVMNAFVERSPGYQWRNDAGVVLIEPISIPRSVAAKLLSTPLSGQFKETPSNDACRVIMDRVDIHSDRATTGQAVKYASVSIVVDSQPVLPALNAIARKDGQMMWILSFRKGWVFTRYSFVTASWRAEPAVKRSGIP